MMKRLGEGGEEGEERGGEKGEGSRSSALTVPSYLTHWWPMLAPLVRRFVSVPYHPDNFVQPGAPEVIVDPPH